MKKYFKTIVLSLIAIVFLSGCATNQRNAMCVGVSVISIISASNGGNATVICH